MLHNAKKLMDYRLESLDGEVGKVADFYFDDHKWVIRYLVARTGGWLTGRQVLISPHALGTAITDEKHIAVNLTKQQIEESPPLASDKPVSRQFEEDYHEHFGWPPYWGGVFTWGPYQYPYPHPAKAETPEPPPAEEKQTGDPHLRSTGEVIGYHLQASNGELGHVDDFIVDDENWAIRYLVIDTRNWLPGKKVLVLPKWIERTSWTTTKVFLNLPRIAIQEAPEYDANAPITRDYEEKLHQHYRQNGYWATEKTALTQTR